MDIATLPKKGLKTSPYSIDMNERNLNKCDHTIYMDMNMATLPKRDFKTSPYSMDMSKRDLNTSPYSMDMSKRDLKTSPYSIDMEKKDLKKLTKGQLIKLLMSQRKNEEVESIRKPTPSLRTGKWESVKPKPVPRKSVKQMVKEYEDIIQPPDGYKPIPKPRTDRPLQLEEHITNVSVPEIKELNRALKGYAKPYGIELQDSSNPLNHFTKTKALVKSHLEDLLKDMKGFKFIETLEVTFEKDNIDSKTGKRVSIYKTAFFNGKAKTITKPNDIEPELSMSGQEIMNAIDEWVSEGSGWVIDSINNHYINVTTYKPLHGSSYVELPTELRNPKKGLINIKNKDDECFRWCHIRHLNPQIEHPVRIKKGDKQMINELNYEGIEFPKPQKQYNKVEKQNSIRINVFGYEKGQPFPIHISKETFKDQMNLLLITKDEKSALRPNKRLQFVHVQPN